MYQLHSDSENFKIMRRLFEQVPGVIYQYRLYPDGRHCFPFTSESIKDFSGLAPEDIVEDASCLFAMICSEDLPSLQASIMSSAQTLENWDHEFRFNHPKKGLRWYQGFSRPEKMNDGSILWNGFFTDVTERRKLEEDLHAALKIRDEFISIASHELKTPLTSLKLQLQMMSRARQVKTNIDEEKFSKSLDVSVRQVDRLSYLVENLLDATRIDAGVLNLELKELNLTKAFEDVIERCGPLFVEAKCVVNVKIEKEISGKFDPNRIEQVFLNLLSNAIKYAPGMPIDLELTKENSFVTIKVKDHGTGIQEEKLKKIFRRFERVDISPNVSGLGLGLYITKEIIELHGGEISVVSEVGKGSIFNIKLPLKS